MSPPTPALSSGARELQPLAPSRPPRPRPSEWSRPYHCCCLSIALLVATSPLLMLAMHACASLSAGGAMQHASCDHGVHMLPEFSINSSSEIAIATYLDDGPRGESRRTARLSLQNKRSYALAHGYALHVFGAALPDCSRRGEGSLKLLALRRLNLVGNHAWVLWLDPDVMILNQARPLHEAFGASVLHGEELDRGDQPPLDPRAPGVELLLPSGGDRGVSLHLLLIRLRGEGARCMLDHAIAMRSCVARRAGRFSSSSDPPALLALLRPRKPHELECSRQQWPASCAPSPLPTPPQGESPTPDYSSKMVVLPKHVLEGAREYEGGFAIQVNECIAGHRSRSLRWCEATFSHFQNLSRNRKVLSRATYAV
ncbi:MAG: hypothetical protein SGPRY_003258 [Prymnesium sp.]